MNSTAKTVLFWVAIALSAVLLWTVIKTNSPGQKEKEYAYSEFMGYVDQGNVAEVKIDGQELLIMKESDIMGIIDERASKKKAA